MDSRKDAECAAFNNKQYTIPTFKIIIWKELQKNRTQGFLRYFAGPQNGKSDPLESEEIIRGHI